MTEQITIQKIRFDIDPKTTALIVVDMMNDFLLPGFPFEIPAGREMVPKLKEVIELCRSKGSRVIYTVHYHRKDLSDAGIMGKLWPAIRERFFCAEGSEGIRIYEPIAPTEKDIIVTKHRQSAFFDTDMDMILRGLNVKSVVITGVATSGCCYCTALDAYYRDYEVTFLFDLNEGLDIPDVGWGVIPREEINKVFGANFGLIFGQVITSDEFIKLIK